MFDCLHLRSPRVAARADRGGHAGVADIVDPHLNIDRLIQVDAAKDDAGIRCSRSQGQLDALTAVDADTDGAGQRLDGSLLKHGRDCQ